MHYHLAKISYADTYVSLTFPSKIHNIDHCVHNVYYVYCVFIFIIFYSDVLKL